MSRRRPRSVPELAPDERLGDGAATSRDDGGDGSTAATARRSEPPDQLGGETAGSAPDVQGPQSRVDLGGVGEGHRQGR